MDFIYGFSNNYVRVKSNWRNDLADKIISFKLEEIDNDGLVVGKKIRFKNYNLTPIGSNSLNSLFFLMNFLT